MEKAHVMLRARGVYVCWPAGGASCPSSNSTCAVCSGTETTHLKLEQIGTGRETK